MSVETVACLSCFGADAQGFPGGTQLSLSKDASLVHIWEYGIRCEGNSTYRLFVSLCM